MLLWLSHHMIDTENPLPLEIVFFSYAFRDPFISNLQRHERWEGHWPEGDAESVVKSTPAFKLMGIYQCVNLKVSPMPESAHH